MNNSLCYLITGGAGSLGRRLVAYLLRDDISNPPKAIRVFDNHENSLVRLERQLEDPDKKLRFLLGDIRDRNRLKLAMENIDITVLCAAAKHVHICEQNPFESIMTNVIGTQNCIETALESNVNKVLFVSSDKAVQPINTYAKCKSLSESLILDAMNYKGDKRTSFSVARPPNYINSDGSVFEVWNEQKAKGLPLTVTSDKMTRFFMSFDEITKFIMKCLVHMEGGEVFVPIGAREMRIIDLAREISENIQITGIRKGEKLKEILIAPDEIVRAEQKEGMWVIH